MSEGAITVVFSQLAPVNAATAGFLYLIVVLGTAAVGGLAEGVIVSVVAMVCYNVFFLPPIGRFTIADPQNWVALFTFLLTALVASHLSDRAQKRAMEAKLRQRETEQLYELSRAILLNDASQPIGSQVAQHIAHIFDLPIVVLFDSTTGRSFPGGAGDLSGLEPIFQQVTSHGNAHHDPATGVDFWPISLGGRPIGVLAAKGAGISEGAVQALLNLVAIALERVRAEESANRAEAARQSEEFKSTVLDSIAHEFKTPLTSIKAASTSLLAGGESLGSPQRELASIIDEEADRLSLLVTEAVKMSEIDAGKVKLERSPVSVGELDEQSGLQFWSQSRRSHRRNRECERHALRVHRSQADDSGAPAVDRQRSQVFNAPRRD